jgi:hypothetical protein
MAGNRRCIPPWSGKVVGRFKVQIFPDNPENPINVTDTTVTTIGLNLSIDDLDDLIYALTKAKWRVLKPENC